MTKYKNKILIISGIVCALGAICMAIAMMTVKFDVKALDLCGEPQQISKSYDVKDIKAISVKQYNSEVLVKKSSDDKIHVTYYTTDCCPTVSELTQDSEIKLYDDFWDYGIKQYTKGFFHGYKKHGLKTIIELPENSNAINIKTETSNGKITVENINVNKAEFYTSNGKIQFSNIVSDTFCGNTVNGSVTADKITADNISLGTTNGHIKVSALKADKLSTTTSNGAITVKNVNAKSAEMTTSNGGISLSDIKSENLIKASTSNGAIDISNISSDNITLQTSNGSILGNITGNPDNYNISSSTSNGNDSLAIYNNKNKTSNKKIEAYTSNGNILVEFTE
ncbi:MAG: DUF4097 family beta strand repeat-containing protein [Clostridia bacterium]|nr:DUF4097 family beta strand repeat-containing protein [Clostridia bacterium]